MINLQKINWKLRENFGEVWLIKTKNGYHFTGPLTTLWPVTKVNVNRLSELTIDDWVKRCGELVEDNNWQTKLSNFERNLYETKNF